MALAVFGLSTAWLLYVLAGYPALLGWLARRRSHPVAKKRIQPPITLILAVHNGAQYVRQKLDSILALHYPAERMEILVVSDGSTDETAALVESYRSRGVELIELPRGGKPAALNAGIARAKGDILILTDVRQTLDPDSVQHLVDNFADPQVGVVSGNLIIRQGERPDEQDTSRYWDYERWIRIELSRMDSIFGATGSFYAIRRELAVRIPDDMLLDDMYQPLAAYFRGYRLIVEEQARIYDYPTTLGAEFPRKVRTLAGNYQILQAYPQLLGPANRLWFHFVSYKLGRLFLPHALLAMAAATLFLPGWLGRVALGGQVAFYGMAWMDRFVVPGWVVKKVTSPCRTFVTLMAAAVCALSVFFVEPRKLWKVTQ